MTKSLTESLIRLFGLYLLIHSLLQFAGDLAANFDLNRALAGMGNSGYRGYSARWGELIVESLVRMSVPLFGGILLLRNSRRLAAFVSREMNDGA